MDLLEIVMAVTIAGICGALAEYIVGYSSANLTIVVLMGVVGAYLGNSIGLAVQRATDYFPAFVLVSIGGLSFDLVWAVIGACLFWLILVLLRADRVVSVFRRSAATP